jgi:DinB superfamily
MISSASLTWNFERNASYLRTHLTDLTHADSLVQPPTEGNCINWIVGHIVCYRNYALTCCGLTPVVAEKMAKRYARESAPVLGKAGDVAHLADLQAAFERSQEQLTTYLNAMTPQQAATEVSAADFTMPRAELLLSFMRHESYHAGQLEWLRGWVLQARH